MQFEPGIEGKIEMTSKIFGWRGKILKVDLSTSRITELDTMDYADRFLGGRGIATKIYWDEVGPEVSAFDPENELILMTGPLGATGAQGASRFEVVGKSPMAVPERFCYGNLGGSFGPYLKKAGYDGVVITGRAERPRYLWVKDGKAEILDASLLWGKGVYQVRDMLREKHGEQIRFVTTGAAGENLCRIATIMTDLEGSATGGFGGVMGSKNLKAIAVMGTGKPAVARPRKLVELNRLTRRLHVDRGDLGRIGMPEIYRREVSKSRKALCYQCGLGCMRAIFRIASGKQVLRKCQSMAFYMPWVEKRQNEPMDTALDVTEICNDFSLCTMELQNIIQWLEDCHNSGYLTEKETGLDFSKLGSREFVERLVALVARREGFGDILAEGLLRAGQKLGERALAHFNENVSGVGGTFNSPREYTITSLLYAFEPRQPLSMVNEVGYMIGFWLVNRFLPDKSPLTTEVFRAVADRFWGSDKAWDLTSYEGKAKAAATIQNRSYANESLVLCNVAWPMMFSFNTPDHVGDSTLESKLFSAATGIDTDEAGLHLYGERIFNLQRGILLREGWHAKEADVPAEFNFTMPVETSEVNPLLAVPGPSGEPVSIKGRTLDRKKFEEMRQEYYVLRGWDAETGLQKAGTLERLGLSDLANDLKQKGLLK